MMGITDDGKLIGMLSKDYTREMYEVEKSRWPPTDLPKTLEEDEQLFKLCADRRELLFGLQKILNGPLRDYPTNPSVFSWIKWNLTKFTKFLKSFNP